MKFLPLFILISITGFSQGKPSQGNQLYCHLFETINLHVTPDINSSVIAKINYQDTVYLREKTNQGIVNHPLRGRFYKVMYKGKTGYTTNAGFSKYPPADTSERFQYIKDYLFGKFKYLGGEDKFEVPDAFQSNVKKKCYFHGFTYEFSGAECDVTEIVKTRLLEIEQAIELFRTINNVYHDIHLDYRKYHTEKDEYGEDCLAYVYTDDNKLFPSNLYCSVKLQKVGVEWAKFFWDWEAGGGSLEFKKDKKGNTVITHTYGCH